jgi:hypothetical protein
VFDAQLRGTLPATGQSPNGAAECLEALAMRFQVGRQGGQTFPQMVLLGLVKSRYRLWPIPSRRAHDKKREHI